MSKPDRLSLLVVGKTEMGKSYIVKQKVIPELEKHKPVVIFDRKAEYAGPRAKDVPKEWKVFGGIWDFLESLKGKGSTLSGVNVVKCRADHDYIVGARFVHDLADQYEKSISVVWDEAHGIFIWPEFYEAKKSAVKLCRYGSHANIDMVFISQRTLDLPKGFRTQFDSVISFYQGDEGSQRAIQEITSCDIDKAEKISKLKPRDYILFGKTTDHLKKLKNKSYA